MTTKPKSKSKPTGPKSKTQGAPPELPTELVDPTSPAQTAGPSRAAIEIPIGPVDPRAYRSTHLDVSRLTPQQSHGLRRVQNGLDLTRAVLDSGRRVTTPADAIRWLLEQIAISPSVAAEPQLP